MFARIRGRLYLRTCEAQCSPVVLFFFFGLNVERHLRDHNGDVSYFFFMCICTCTIYDHRNANVSAYAHSYDKRCKLQMKENTHAINGHNTNIIEFNFHSSAFLEHFSFVLKRNLCATISNNKCSKLPVR